MREVNFTCEYIYANYFCTELVDCETARLGIANGTSRPRLRASMWLIARHRCRFRAPFFSYRLRPLLDFLEKWKVLRQVKNGVYVSQVYAHCHASMPYGLTADDVRTILLVLCTLCMV